VQSSWGGISADCNWKNRNGAAQQDREGHTPRTETGEASADGKRGGIFDLEAGKKDGSFIM